MQPIFVDRPLSPRSEGHKPASRGATAKGEVGKLNLAESPLGWLCARGYLSQRLFAAGDQLRADYDRAGLASRTTMDWDAAPLVKQARGANRQEEETIAMVEAKQRFDGAIAHAGPVFTDILWRVVCACESLAEIEGKFGWPRRSARVVLSLALDRVANYYRIK